MPSSPEPPKPIRQVAVDDRVTLRKPHPCGATDWLVTRVGADIGLRCQGCGRKALLPRHEFERRAKALHSDAPDPWRETPNHAADVQ